MARPEARDCITLYNDAKSIRSVNEADWRMASAYCLPRHFSLWSTDGPASIAGASTAARRYAYDNTGVRSLPKYAAILNRIGTPQGQRWHKLQATNTDLMKLHHVRAFYDELTNLLFKKRYEPRARYGQAIGEVYQSIGVYGMGPNAITWRKPSPLDPRGGFSYKAWPLRDIFILVDDEGNVTHVFRRFFLNARQYRRKFPKNLEDAPKSVRAELDKPNPSETSFFEFFHLTYLREDYDENAIDARRHPVCSSYVCVQDAVYVGDEQGFRTMPMLTPRVDTEPGDIYGYSPAVRALPALGGVSAMKKTVLKQGQKAVEPTILAHDDGVLSGRVDLRPGAVNYGGVNAAGQKLIHGLELGDFRVAEQLLTDERTDIEDSFFVTLFQILQESQEMTATEVVERIADRAALVAPSMGRLQAEQYGPQIEREIALLVENGELSLEANPRNPNVLIMPPELIEARGEYDVVYTSPLAKGQFAEEVGGFMRWVEMALNYAAQTKDPAPLDWINFDAAMPEIADYLAVRTSWVADTKVVELKRKQREEQVQDQQVVDSSPAMASVFATMMKHQGGGTTNPKGVSN